ncbi:MAG: EAL domain-containing protein [Gammaproteobacteria bacterium]|nr:EAL domain-containing protein [Gammaproteobacteria bacterium]
MLVVKNFNKIINNSWLDLLDLLPNPVSLNKQITQSDGSSYDEIVFVNKAFINSIGYNTQDIPTDQHWFKLAYPDEDYRNFIISSWVKGIERAEKDNTNLLGFPAKVMCKDKVERWFEVTTHLDYSIFEEFKTIVFVQVQTPKDTILELQSVTRSLEKRNIELLKKEKSITEQFSLINNIIDSVPVRIFWKNKKGEYLGANKLFLQDAGLSSQEEILGKTDFQLPWGETEGALYRSDDVAVMESGKPRLNFEENQTTENGEAITLLTSKIPLKDMDDNTIGILGSYSDITKQRQTEHELIAQKNALAHMAHHDDLTGIANRTLFNDRLEHGIAKAKRNDTIMALLFIDLDNFKTINDSLGHSVGDEVLKFMTETIIKTIRDEDTVARLGGDEFTIILEGLKKESDASVLAQKIINSLEEPIEIDGNKLYVTASIGISLYPTDGETTEELLQYADSAMYKAKSEGKNNFQYYSSDITKMAFERVVMETNLRSSIENEEFEVYYQPQINGNTDELIGMEALVRWKSPLLGIVSPNRFIPLAESTGLIIPIDNFVMRTAMRQFASWYEEGLNPGTLSLNLAMKQLQQNNFFEILEALLKETGCKPEWIELEVTEGQIMENFDHAINILNQISDMGIELAIDDFGTGYSSLAYLKKLPINKLKIDKSFVRELPFNEEDIAISKAIIALAESLKLKVLAEGVETKAQKEFLVQHGCPNIQGYYYSKPVTSKKIKQFLKNTSSSKVIKSKK